MNRLKETAIPQIPLNCDTAMMREFMIEEFNRDGCDLDKKSRSPLAAVEYRPKKEWGTLNMDIADGMMVLPWWEVFGLGYDQIISLPYDEWRELSARLLEHVEKRGPTHTELQTKFLSELVQAMQRLAADLLSVFRAMIPGGNKPNVPYDPRIHGEGNKPGSQPSSR